MHYQPTFPIFETARNVKQFCKSNFAFFKKLMFALAPYLLIIEFVNNYFSMGGAEGREFHPISLLTHLASFYFYALLAVAWHRFVILDAPQSPIDVFVPEKRHWLFLGYMLLIGIGSMIAFGVIFGIVFFIFKDVPVILAPLSFVMICLYLWGLMRLALLFPAIATDSKLKLTEAFRLSEGLAWKMMSTPFVASFTAILLIILYLIIMAGVTIVAITLFHDLELPHVVHAVLLTLITAPLTVLGASWLTVLSITSISNYFLWATKGKSA